MVVLTAQHYSALLICNFTKLLSFKKELAANCCHSYTLKKRKKVKPLLIYGVFSEYLNKFQNCHFIVQPAVFKTHLCTLLLFIAGLIVVRLWVQNQTLHTKPNHTHLF